MEQVLHSLNTPGQPCRTYPTAMDRPSICRLAEDYVRWAGDPAYRARRAAPSTGAKGTNSASAQQQAQAQQP